MVTLEKSNSALGKTSDTPFDADDPRNTGVLSDERICSSKGYPLRRVRYRDPEKGKLCSFITSEFTLPPGLIAFIYKLRRDVEKTFDQVKNLFGEKKASEATASAGRVFNPLVSGVRRVTKRSAQFVGWLQACLEHRSC